MMVNDVKVLALPFGEYYEPLKRIFIRGRLQYNWKICALAKSTNFTSYREFLDSPSQLILFPNLMESQSWEDDAVVVQEIKGLMEACEAAVEIPINRILLSNERNIGRAYSTSHYYWAERKIVK